MMIDHDESLQDRLSTSWKQVLAGIVATAICGICALIVGSSQFLGDRIDSFSNTRAQSTAISLLSKQVLVLEEIATRQADAIGSQNPAVATALAEDLQFLLATKSYLEDSIREIAETPQPRTQGSPVATVFSKTTPTPKFPSVGVSQEVLVSEAETVSVFEESIYISLLEASSQDNEVTAIISTPGFPQARLDRMNAGFKFVYEATGRFEVLVMGFGTGFYDSARFKITHLGPTGFEPKIVAPSMRLTIGEADSGTFYGGDLVISVLEASANSNKVSAIVSSPGFESMTVEEKGVGYIFQYAGSHIYEILLSGYGSSFYDSAEFIVSQLK
jgi:hypothetical protein